MERLKLFGLTLAIGLPLGHLFDLIVKIAENFGYTKHIWLEILNGLLIGVVAYHLAKKLKL